VARSEALDLSTQRMDALEMTADDVLEIALVAAGETAESRFDRTHSPGKHGTDHRQRDHRSDEPEDDWSKVRGDGRVQVDGWFLRGVDPSLAAASHPAPIGC